MTKDIEKKSVQDRYQHLFKVMSGKRFLLKQGLGNEVPFFICPYKPEDSLEMERLLRQLVKSLENIGISVLEVNLYDLSVRLLRERGLWNELLEKEMEFGKDQLRELLQGVLDPENYVVPAISNLLTEVEFDILFISGVGEVFPYIRSHNILNNLQSKAKEKPTVLFFPGTYTQSPESGASLDLFGRLHDDKYYRAFNIYHCEA